MLKLHFQAKQGNQEYLWLSLVVPQKKKYLWLSLVVPRCYNLSAVAALSCKSVTCCLMCCLSSCYPTHKLFCSSRQSLTVTIYSSLKYWEISWVVIWLSVVGYDALVRLQWYNRYIALLWPPVMTHNIWAAHQVQIFANPKSHLNI